MHFPSHQEWIWRFNIETEKKYTPSSLYNRGNYVLWDLIMNRIFYNFQNFLKMSVDAGWIWTFARKLHVFHSNLQRKLYFNWTLFSIFSFLCFYTWNNACWKYLICYFLFKLSVAPLHFMLLVCSFTVCDSNYIRLISKIIKFKYFI